MFARHISRWSVLQTLVCLLLISPIVAIIIVAFQPAPSLLGHLIETVLGRYLLNTLALMAGVGLLAGFFGVSSAWVVSRYEFKGRRLFDWLLVLPAAIPAYIIAYAYTDFLEFAGPLQTALRNILGVTSARDYWFFEIRSLGGAIVMMAAVLYPYVYIMSRTAFRQTSRTLFEAAMVSGRDLFYQVGLPLARPAIIAGLALVLMEVISDFGTVEYFAVDTLTLGIFNVWLGMNNMPAAAQLSLIALVVIIGLLGTEIYARSRRSFQNLSNTKRGAALVIGLLSHYRLGKGARILAFIASTGYAFPGTILAIGVLGFMGGLNHVMSLIGAPYLSGGLLALVIGYMVRFHAVGYGAVETGIGRVPKHLFEASTVLGKSFTQSLLGVVLPIISPSVGAGILLVFVDVMKELPMTLLLRPFNFETFATFTYQYAKDEMIEQAALPALMIVLTGLIPVILLNYSVTRSQR